MRFGAIVRTGRTWPRWLATAHGMPSSTPRVMSLAMSLLPPSAWSRSGAVYLHVDGQRLPGVAAEPLSEAFGRALLPADAGPGYGEDVEDGPTRYGYQKSWVRAGRTSTFGAERSYSSPSRRGFRAARIRRQAAVVAQKGRSGGGCLAPGSPDRLIQPVDVRDLAGFTIRSAAGADPGATTHRTGRPGDLRRHARACAVHRVRAEFAWVADEQLLAYGVRQWSEIPLWRTFPGAWQLIPRPPTLGAFPAAHWRRPWLTHGRGCKMTPRGWTDERESEIGISREREEQILARVA